ncbi:ATP-dependent DNA helicase, Rep family [Austwickia chelonae]|uniref:DNA 3'-5' helicase n=1 Tax=Austwickia chelonae NBRC 105200 TaxID=1184607 RepID=K6VNH8_9MICO|nr:ATP-dependent DNA helicase UvrD2 [Austwickia chelonae]GAB78289.1 putative ATP-dependent DNA helicase [Austwickia chelonae NBRC 105200]SEW00537.1 ATP-dependent DNA helicase, Rep family [Austwickia chelonae]
MRPVADADAVLSNLDPQQREVASQPLGAMCVLAGAGTGKTRAITHRIAYGVHAGAYVPGRVLAVTFTSRAAGEMRTRLRALGVGGVQARTFHAAALRQLAYFWPKAIGGAPPQLLPQKSGAVSEACHHLGIQADRATIRDLSAEIEWAKVSGVTAETYAAAAGRARRDPAGVDLTTVARLLDAYETVKTGRAVIDFEDVLLILCGILADRPDIAREVRTQYRHFVVDEYQDVNAVQQRLLDLWVGEREDLCVVGDPQQTIYSFTGADPRHLLEFTRRRPQAALVRLVRNYRSSPQIVSLANAVWGDRARSGGMSAPLRLEAQGASGPPPVLTAFPDEESEAAGVVAQIRSRIAAGTPPGEMAILFRTNAQSVVFEQALAAAEVPYLVKGGERFFRRDEVRRALVLLRGAAVSDDGSSALPGLVGDVLAGVGWSPQAPSGGGAVRERWESLAALVQVAEDLVAVSPGARLRDLVGELDERSAAQHPPSMQGVTLASLHAAKGLEWDVVFLAGCSDGYMPIMMADGPDAVEEERRLMYVGLTRARRELRLSWAGARAPGGRQTRRPSRFLAEVSTLVGSQSAPGAGGRPAGGSAGDGGRVRRAPLPSTCRSCGGPLESAAERKMGRCVGCPPSYDPEIFEQLQRWRSAVAGRDRVPPFVVFTDATLTVIAEREPRDLAALSQVPGVGARKVGRYGLAVLTVVAGGDVDRAVALVDTGPRGKNTDGSRTE